MPSNAYGEPALRVSSLRAVSAPEGACKTLAEFGICLQVVPEACSVVWKGRRNRAETLLLLCGAEDKADGLRAGPACLREGTCTLAGPGELCRGRM